MSDEDFDIFEGASPLSDRILEMCDRVKAAHKIVPGAVATQVIEIDGTLFRVKVLIAAADKGTDHVG